MTILSTSSYTESDSKIGLYQGGARHLSQSKTASKQPNLNKLGDADGLKGRGCPTLVEPIFESRAVYIMMERLTEDPSVERQSAVSVAMSDCSQVLRLAENLLFGALSIAVALVMALPMLVPHGARVPVAIVLGVAGACLLPVSPLATVVCWGVAGLCLIADITTEVN